MATKTTGAELKAFYNDDAYWQKSAGNNADNIWHEELVLEVNGAEQSDDFSITQDLQDADQVKIVDGVVLSNIDGFQGRSFESFFKAWRKQQSTTYLTVAVPKEKLEAVRSVILEAGGKIK